MLLPRKPLPSLLVQSRAHVLSLLTCICTVQHSRADSAASLPPSFPRAGLGNQGWGRAAGLGGLEMGPVGMCHVQ